jgi:hypothetical protein
MSSISRSVRRQVVAKAYYCSDRKPFQGKRELLIKKRERLAAYNELLSQVDEAYSQVLDAEQDLSDLSSKLLTGVGMQYGKSSLEYATVGGARQGDRRRRRAVAPRLG